MRFDETAGMGADDAEWDRVRAGNGPVNDERREEATVVDETRCRLGQRPSARR